MENSRPENSHSKLPKIKTFQAIQKSLAMVGISPELATQTYSLNGRLLLDFALFGSGVTFQSVYISNDAKTFSEYTQSIYVASAGLLIVFILIVLILKVNELFDLTKRYDSILNMCK